MSTTIRTWKHEGPLGTSEGAIFSRVLEPDRATLPVAAARAILALGFCQFDQDRLRLLSAKAQEGTLSSDDQAAINNYERVGHILSLMKLKARRSLKGRATNRKAKAH
jgi:hypothetical protein